MPLCLLKGEGRAEAMECKELKRLGVEKDTHSGAYLYPPFAAE